MPYPNNRLSTEEHRLRSKIITYYLLRSDAYQNCRSLHLYESYSDEVDTQYIMHHAKKSSRDIYRPTSDPLNNEIADIIVIPGRKFDMHMTRHGRGCGYYDRFLHNITAIKIGLCYQMQLFDKLKRKSWDIPMDMVITEKGIFMPAV